jgi:hypothetical protein
MTTTLSRIIPVISMLFAGSILAMGSYSETTYYESGVILSTSGVMLDDSLKSILGTVLVSGAGLGAVKSMVNTRITKGK